MAPSGTPADVKAALVAAMERLLERGTAYGEITVQAVAREASISRSAFYVHFHGKTELVAYLLRTVVEELSRGAGEWFVHPEAAEEATIARAVEGVVAVYRHRAEIMRAVSAASAEDPRAAVLFRDTMRELLVRNRRVVRGATANRRARRDLSLEVGDALLWMIHRCSEALPLVEREEERARMIQALTHIVWHSLFSDAPAR